MGSKKDNNFMPNIAIPPGDTIRENMNYLGMDQEELAARLGITTKHLSNVINGNASLTYEMAIRLEDVIGPSAEFWIQLEAKYQLDKTRLEREASLDKDALILKDIPYKKMCDLNWVKETKAPYGSVSICRDFFGVAELSNIKSSYDVMFRKQKMNSAISDLSILAWLRKAELDGMKAEINKFSRKKLKESINKFRDLIMEDPSDAYPRMVTLCAECGISLVLVECLPKTSICGGTIWRNGKAIIALSLRGKNADILWLTFFHEIEYLLKHDKKEFHISYENNASECEADK